LNICFPYYVIEPILQNLTVQSWFAQSKRKVTYDSVEIITDRLTISKVPMIVKIGQSQITLRESVNMKVGDVLTLDARVNQELKVIVKDKIKFFCQPGNLGRKRAIKITHPVSKEEEKLYE
jgi:flagellar motor switch protein FliM